MTSILVFGSTLRSLRRNLLRSALTTLGVIVGVAAVVVTTSVGNGARERILATLATPESRAVYLAAVPRMSTRSDGIVPLQPSDFLNADDYDAIRGRINGISAASPVLDVPNVRAKALGRSANVIVDGIDAQAFEIAGRALLFGAGLNERDAVHSRTVCVISESLAQKLFGTDNAVGRSILISDTVFTVIGIADDIRGVGGLNVPKQGDLRVYVPYTSLQRRLNPTAPMSIVVQARDVEHVARVQAAINDLMAERQRDRRAEFLTSNSIDAVKAYSDSALAVARLLAAMGGLSLIVGGIGIMNVMMTAVTERTREIGIRMAIGTRTTSILIQFLLEAVALAALGGIVGVVLGAAASEAYGRLNGWPTSTTLSSVAIVILCSMIVGVVSGVQPARRAARLSPVLAIRNDT